MKNKNKKIKNLDEKKFLEYVIEEIETILKDGGNAEPFKKESNVLFAITDNNHVILTYPAIANALKELDKEHQKIFIEELKKNWCIEKS